MMRLFHSRFAWLGLAFFGLAVLRFLFGNGVLS